VGCANTRLHPWLGSVFDHIRAFNHQVFPEEPGTLEICLRSGKVIVGMLLNGKSTGVPPLRCGVLRNRTCRQERTTPSHLPENGGGLVGLGTQKSDRSRRGIEVHLAQLLAVRALLCLRLSLLR
jgi:hypothetical protein